MTKTKEIFHRRPKLRRWSNAVVNHEQFDELVSFARAHIMETRMLSIPQQEGIRDFVQALKDLVVPEDDQAAQLESGLIHDTDPASAAALRDKLDPERQTKETKKG